MWGLQSVEWLWQFGDCRVLSVWENVGTTECSVTVTMWGLQSVECLGECGDYRVLSDCDNVGATEAGAGCCVQGGICSLVRHHRQITPYQYQRLAFRASRLSHLFSKLHCLQPVITLWSASCCFNIYDIPFPSVTRWQAWALSWNVVKFTTCPLHLCHFCLSLANTASWLAAVWLRECLMTQPPCGSGFRSLC